MLEPVLPAKSRAFVFVKPFYVPALATNNEKWLWANFPLESEVGLSLVHIEPFGTV